MEQTDQHWTNNMKTASNKSIWGGSASGNITLKLTDKKCLDEELSLYIDSLLHSPTNSQHIPQQAPSQPSPCPTSLTMYTHRHTHLIKAQQNSPTPTHRHSTQNTRDLHTAAAFSQHHRHPYTSLTQHEASSQSMPG